MSNTEPSQNQKLSSYAWGNADDMYQPDTFNLIDYQIWKASVERQHMLPCKVVEVVFDTNEVVVQPLIMSLSPNLDENGTYAQRERPKIRTTIWREMAGGMMIYFPISVGDTGWIVAADRDTTTLKTTNMAESIPPPTFSVSNYEFGYFIPDVVTKRFTVANSDEKCLSIQSTDGEVKVVINPNTHEVTITAPTVTINGNLNVNGTITSSGNGTFGGINFNTHRHAPSSKPPSNP